MARRTRFGGGAARVAAGLGVALALAAAAPAWAGGECVDDVQRLCPNVKPGDGRILVCLQARWKDVSSPCQQAIDTAKGQLRQVLLACEADVYVYCGGVPLGQGRLATCLRARWDDLSSTCKNVLGQ